MPQDEVAPQRTVTLLPAVTSDVGAVKTPGVAGARFIVAVEPVLHPDFPPVGISVP